MHVWSAALTALALVVAGLSTGHEPAGLELDVVAARDAMRPFEPLLVSVRARNRGAEPIPPPQLDASLGLLQSAITSPEGSRVTP